ncbi:unnamed protein product, partial [Hymenolepis diminuta]
IYTPNKDHIRHIPLFQFHRGNTASSAANTLKDTYGNDVVSEKTCRRWFSAGGFKKDDFSLKDEPRVGCSKNSLLSNWKLPLMKIQSALLEKTINREMKRLGKVSKAGERVPHDFSEINKQQRVVSAAFYCVLVNFSDEKWWILYNNVKRKRLWLSQDSGSKPIPQLRSGPHSKNSSVCMVGFEGNCLL